MQTETNKINQNQQGETYIAIFKKIIFFFFWSVGLVLSENFKAQYKMYLIFSLENHYARSNTNLRKW